MPLPATGEQSGRHVVEACTKLAESRGGVEEDEWQTRHSREAEREVGVGVEKEKPEKEEGDIMESFFCAVFFIFDELRELRFPREQSFLCNLPLSRSDTSYSAFSKLRPPAMPP